MTFTPHASYIIILASVQSLVAQSVYDFLLRLAQPHTFWNMLTAQMASPAQPTT